MTCKYHYFNDQATAVSCGFLGRWLHIIFNTPLCRNQIPANFGLIKFITELQNFNKVQSHDRTVNQQQQMINERTLSESVVDD